MSTSTTTMYTWLTYTMPASTTTMTYMYINYYNVYKNDYQQTMTTDYQTIKDYNYYTDNVYIIVLNCKSVIMP